MTALKRNSGIFRFLLLNLINVVFNLSLEYSVKLFNGHLYLHKPNLT